MQHEMWKVLCLLVGEGTIEQLVDSVVDGGGICEPSGNGNCNTK